MGANRELNSVDRIWAEGKGYGCRSDMTSENTTAGPVLNGGKREAVWFALSSEQIGGSIVFAPASGSSLTRGSSNRIHRLGTTLIKDGLPCGPANISVIVPSSGYFPRWL